MGKDAPLQPAIRYVMEHDRFDEEINLIDLWIELTRFRKVFAIALLAVLIPGGAYLAVNYEEKYALTSMIQIGSARVDDQIVQIESTDALSSKLNKLLVPHTTAVWSAKSVEFGHPKTQVEQVKNSDVVLISNVVKPDEMNIYKTYQLDLIRQVLEDHRSKMSVYQSATLSALNVAKIRLESLRDPKLLKMQLDLIDRDISTRDVKRPVIQIPIAGHD